MFYGNKTIATTNM